MFGDENSPFSPSIALIFLIKKKLIEGPACNLPVLKKFKFKFSFPGVGDQVNKCKVHGIVLVDREKRYYWLVDYNTVR